MPSKGEKSASAADKSTGSSKSVSNKATPKIDSPLSQIGSPSSGVSTHVEMAAVPTTEAELLGSLTTEQQQRTSARVIKKLRLDSTVNAEQDGIDKEKKDYTDIDRDKDPTCEKDTNKINTVRQRTIWSTDEKNLFFEALNEYGKEFDAITAHICAKMKRKGIPAMKTKLQVSHFYYRTWHKLSKYVKFDEGIKKVAQELYVLINYGEMRRKLGSINEKNCARLQEIICKGSVLMRFRGRNVRIRTPMCRALRRLNRLNDHEEPVRVPPRVCVCVRARGASDWARVLSVAHNPRAALYAPPRTLLVTLLKALAARWEHASKKSNYQDVNKEKDSGIEDCGPNDTKTECMDETIDDNKISIAHNHLNLEPERIVTLEKSKNHILHVGPSPDCEIHLPVVSLSEPMSSQRISYTAYLERIEQDREKEKDPTVKIKTPKRQRKDSGDMSKELETKKQKTEEEPKLLNIDETAIDGIELMATLNENRLTEIKEAEHDDSNQQTEGELCDKERDNADNALEKDSLSELEDDDKNDAGSDLDDIVDKPVRVGCVKNEKFKNLKVKFRVRTRKRGIANYAIVNENDEIPANKDKGWDLSLVMRQVRKGWSAHDSGQLTIGDLYLMFGVNSRLYLDYWWDEPQPPLPDSVLEQIKSKCSGQNANQECVDVKTSPSERTQDDKTSRQLPVLETIVFDDDKERARESDTDILSPKHIYSQDSNDAVSGDEKKEISSPDHKQSRAEHNFNTPFRIASKLINNPNPELTPTKLLESIGEPCNVSNVVTQRDDVVTLTSRLQRLISLAQLCAPVQNVVGVRKNSSHNDEMQGPTHHIFRLPIAPKNTNHHSLSEESLMKDLPQCRRGGRRRPTAAVVVRRLLPILPKPLSDDLPPKHNIAVTISDDEKSQNKKMMPTLLPKPAPVIGSPGSVYVLNKMEDKFYMINGDQANVEHSGVHMKEANETEMNPSGVALREETKPTVTVNSDDIKEPKLLDISLASVAEESMGNSRMDQNSAMSSVWMSPSRLLSSSSGNGCDTWLEPGDFSLSSLLNQLDHTKPPTDVDAQLQCMMSETSLDYMAKFADLAAEVEADNTKD